MQPPTLPSAPLPTRIDYRFRTLDNGLRVVSAPRRQSPTVAIQVWYGVGGKDDPEGRAGFAHLFEHLMFKRTKNLPDEAFDRLTEDVGGENNAYTTPDVTVYHEVVPANYLETLLWAEAERMARLDVTEASFRSEREVVKEEYRQSVLTPPYGRLDDAIERRSWEPPYHRPVIGNIPELDAASLEDVLAFHRAHYRPDNAVLAVAGDFDPRQLDAWVDATFGRVPRPDTPLPSVRRADPAPRTGERRFDERAPQVPLPAVVLSFPTPSVQHPDTPVLEMLDAVLASGQSSRLFQGLVYRRQVASEAFSYLDMRTDAGLLVVQAIAAEGKDAPALEKALLEELTRLQNETVPPTEMARVRDRILTDALRARETTAGVAAALGEAVAILGDPDRTNTHLARLMAVTPADIRRVAQKILVPANRVVIRYSAGPAAPTPPVTPSPPPPSPPPPLRPEATPPKPAARRPLVLPTAQETRLENGVRIATAAHPGSGLVSVHVLIDHGAASDRPGHRGQANFVASLLTRGTTTRSAEQIAAEAEALGGEIAASADWDSLSLSLTVPRTRSAAALRLLADLARHPAFAATEVDRLRAELRADLSVRLQEPGTLAGAVTARLLFGDGPYAGLLSGTPASLRRIARIDAIDFYKATFRPRNAVVSVVGDIAAQDAIAQTRAAFSSWRAASDRTPLPRPRLGVPPVVRRVVLIDLPDAGQAAVVVARPGVARTDRAYPAALLANSILGGGFSSRLNQEIRIRRGLAYGAFSNLSSRAGAGPLQLAAQTKNESAARVAGLMTAALERLPLDPLTDDEINARKASLVGPYARSLETAAGLGAALGRLMVLGLPPSEIAGFAARIDALDEDAVRSVARNRLAARYASVVVAADGRRCLAALRERFGNLRVIPAAKLDLDAPGLIAGKARGRR